jgi:hypothetical protein
MVFSNPFRQLANYDLAMTRLGLLASSPHCDLVIGLAIILLSSTNTVRL